MNKIKIGYEVKSAKEILIPFAHLLVTGITQESGKTTTLEALINRSGYTAVAFKTKVGEKGFQQGTVIPPYFKERFDWEYVLAILESMMKEKMKFQRSWVIRACETAHSIQDVQRNIDNTLANEKLGGLDKSILIELQAFFKKIMPQIQYTNFSNTLDLQEGLNIIDLQRFSTEVQGLVIESVLNTVLNEKKNTIIIIPEAWKHLPEKRNTPVKLTAEAYIRQGATNGNYLWIDSQDVTGTEKRILKQVSTWILGYQKEINEVKRTLDQIPLSKRYKPKPEDIMNLKLGQFFVVTSEFVKKVYVQPSWMDSRTAIKIAKGSLSVDEIKPPTSLAPFKVMAQPEGIKMPSVDTQKYYAKLQEDMSELRNDFFDKIQQMNDYVNNLNSEILGLKASSPTINEDVVVSKILQKIQLPATQSASVDINSLIQQIIPKLPQTGMVQTYTVPPLEKLKKDFLEEAKNKILSDISSLSNDSKKTLKYLESRGVGVKTNEIVIKGFLLSAGGGNNDRVNKAVKELSTVGVAVKDAGGTNFGKLKDRIKELVSVHGATDAEIEQVYNHIVMEMLK